MENTPILVMHLAGVIQSYGNQTHWEYRSSSYVPTKSAVIGILGNALGIERNDKRLIELSKNLQMIVRVDKQGEMMIDYQIIRGELYTADGENVGKNGEITSKISKRQYIQDAYFVVGLTGDRELLDICLKALKNPRRPLYLGRKNCVPSRYLFDKRGIIDDYKDLEEFVNNFELVPRHDDKSLIYYQIEDRKGNKIVYDETLARVGEKYGPRLIRNSPLRGGK